MPSFLNIVSMFSFFNPFSLIFLNFQRLHVCYRHVFSSSFWICFLSACMRYAFLSAFSRHFRLSVFSFSSLLSSSLDSFSRNHQIQKRIVFNSNLASLPSFNSRISSPLLISPLLSQSDITLVWPLSDLSFAFLTSFPIVPIWHDFLHCFDHFFWRAFVLYKIYTFLRILIFLFSFGGGVPLLFRTSPFSFKFPLSS